MMSPDPLAAQVRRLLRPRLIVCIAGAYADGSQTKRQTCGHICWPFDQQNGIAQFVEARRDCQAALTPTECLFCAISKTAVDSDDPAAVIHFRKREAAFRMSPADADSPEGIRTNA